MEQRSLIDFCIVSADLFFTVSDVLVKRGAEGSTDQGSPPSCLHFETLDKTKNFLTTKK